MKQSSNKMVLFCGLAIIVVMTLILYSSRNNAILETDQKYNNDSTYVELEYRTKQLALKTDLIIRFMKENDNDNILANCMTNDDIYSQYIIYENETFDKAHDIDSQLLFLKNIIGNINYANDEINLYLYNLKKNSYKDYIKLVNALDLNKDIEELNQLISEYNKINDTKIVRVSILENTYPNTDRNYNKDLKTKWKSINK